VKFIMKRNTVPRS